MNSAVARFMRRCHLPKYRVHGSTAFAGMTAFLGGEVQKGGVVYILASRRHGTLYIGVTSDLDRRLYEHREGLIDGFTKDYAVHRLVHYEVLDTIEDAILLEKRLKKWRRDWKIRLIETDNPEWRDRALDFGAPAPPVT